LVIAHRGASAEHPENTLAAFEAALRSGADGIELDVRRTADGVPIVYHDRTLSRIGGGRRRVADVDWAELRRLQRGLRRDQRVPLLDEVIDRLADRTTLLVEVKGDGLDHDVDLAERVADRVAICAGPVHVLAFDAALLAVVRRRAAAVPVVLNWAAGRMARWAGWAALSVDVRAAGPVQVRTARRHAAPLWVYTVNTAARARRARQLGAAAIMTDRPDWLRRWLADQSGAASSGGSNSGF